jgi:hypothetical protein
MWINENGYGSLMMPLLLLMPFINGIVLSMSNRHVGLIHMNEVQLKNSKNLFCKQEEESLNKRFIYQ